MRIEIPGDPVPQHRLRHFIRGGHSASFDPSIHDKTRMRKIIQTQVDTDVKQFTRPIVSFLFYFPILQSWSKKKKKLAESERMVKFTRPDADNLVKIVLDCLTGFVWQDDGCVNISGALKLYSPNPRIVVSIEEMPSDLVDDEGVFLCFGESLRRLLTSTDALHDSLSLAS